MNIRLAILISCIVGFVSISMEIIWFSVVGFVSQGHAGIFGLVLSLVLLGIAGSTQFINKRMDRFEGVEASQLIIRLLWWAGGVNLIGLPLTAALMTVHVAFAGLILVNIILVSGFLGCIFPLLCHITIQAVDDRVGRKTSWIYAANIIGATTGPLLTGYILMDHLTVQQIIVSFCIIPVLLALLLSVFLELRQGQRRRAILLSLSILILASLSPFVLYERFWEKLRFAEQFGPDKQFKYLVQDKSGIIAVASTPAGDVFYGGGAYDGAINTDPSDESNLISRAYMTAALHPAPKKVLMIGLSTGSWAKVIADHAGVESFTIVEISTGYLDLVRRYPEVSGILSDKRVKIIIDDGRRWLKLNREEKFDLIVMNTSFHWREHITNLLSFEFLSLCKEHLNTGGVMYWNTTSNPVVVNTACQAFKHVTTYLNFVAASDTPFDMTVEERRQSLLKFMRDGKPVFEQTEPLKALLNTYSQWPLNDIRDSFLQKDLPFITDANMASEYKHRVYKR
jgi:spermidine synthase